MAKTVGMARGMYRLRKRVLESSKIIKTEHGLFMCKADYDKLRHAPQATSAIELSPVGPPRYFGVPIHISETCAPYWRVVGYPLRSWATRHLRRCAHRRA